MVVVVVVVVVIHSVRNCAMKKAAACSQNISNDSMNRFALEENFLTIFCVRIEACSHKMLG